MKQENSHLIKELDQKAGQFPSQTLTESKPDITHIQKQLDEKDEQITNYQQELFNLQAMMAQDQEKVKTEQN